MLPETKLTKIYKGYRTSQGAFVMVYRRGSGLATRLEHQVRHSPTGFEWGYGGSGPAELARCLLIDAVGEAIADRLYQEFKRHVVAGLPENRWRLTEEQIREWVCQQLEGGVVRA